MIKNIMFLWSIPCLKYLFYLSFPVLSGLCSNDCPDGVKVTDPFYCSTVQCLLSVCACVYWHSQFFSCIFHENSYSAFLAGRTDEAGIYTLLAKFIASRQNQLYIQEIKERDLNK